jgi:hypothetical protein
MKRIGLLFLVLAALAVAVVSAEQESTSRDEAPPSEPWQKLEGEAAAYPDREIAASGFHKASMVRSRQVGASITSILGANQVRTLDFQQARVARTEKGLELWLVPGSDIICLAVGPGRGVSCIPRGKASKNGISVGLTKSPSPTKPPTFFLLAGMVPDGVRAVRVRVGSKAIQLPVHNNTFQYAASQPVEIDKVLREVRSVGDRS